MTILGLGEVADFASKLADKLLPDKGQQEKDALAWQIAQLQAQTSVNQAEASNQSVFVAGWRPAVGWSCALAFFWSYVLGPFLNWFAALAGHPVNLPVLDLSAMMPVLLGMLGLGGMRSIEKVKGVSGAH